ncbi:AT-rich interactive domain-containing protein 1B-like [Polyergus mexicanus]|uniref:AT-rich interactive domain-containing protein 1B-like n=1 Tax=Polyergus mexicanus TaxID=615972 RepID=UPI0038B65A2B
MAGWISFFLVATASMIAIAESRVIPDKPTSVIIDSNSSPTTFLREKRTVARPYPHRAMMFTGYYRPIRRSGNDDHATGLFAQGNAVSGQAFFSGMHAPHLKDGPEPIEEPEVPNAQAQAAPASDEEHHHQYHHQNKVHRHEEEQYHEHHHHEEEKHHHHHHQDSSTFQEHHEPEQIPQTTEIPQSAEEPIATSTEVSVTRPKMHHTKKTHKTPVTDDADEDEDEEDYDDDQPAIPFVPFKGNRRRQGFPHLNNFFPMVFSFPRVATRAGSSGSPGTITAIANSYSTGKGGMASSVATAYGGSPMGKKRRPQPYEE